MDVKRQKPGFWEKARLFFVRFSGGVGAEFVAEEAGFDAAVVEGIAVFDGERDFAFEFDVAGEEEDVPTCPGGFPAFSKLAIEGFERLFFAEAFAVGRVGDDDAGLRCGGIEFEGVADGELDEIGYAGAFGIFLGYADDVGINVGSEDEGGGWSNLVLGGGESFSPELGIVVGPFEEAEGFAQGTRGAAGGEERGLDGEGA